MAAQVLRQPPVHVEQWVGYLMSFLLFAQVMHTAACCMWSMPVALAEHVLLTLAADLHALQLCVTAAVAG
jgi:hypothetical protein